MNDGRPARSGFPPGGPQSPPRCRQTRRSCRATIFRCAPNADIIATASNASGSGIGAATCARTPAGSGRSSIRPRRAVARCAQTPGGGSENARFRNGEPTRSQASERGAARAGLSSAAPTRAEESPSKRTPDRAPNATTTKQGAAVAADPAARAGGRDDSQGAIARRRLAGQTRVGSPVASKPRCDVTGQRSRRAFTSGACGSEPERSARKALRRPFQMIR
jgi:hypothetical protein